MTDPTLIAIAVFTATTATTLCLTAVCASDHTTRHRARDILLQILRTNRTR